MTVPNRPTESAAEKLFLEQARAYFHDMRTVAQNAPDGQVINLAEEFAVKCGRELVRKSLEAVLQEQADEYEKKRNDDLSEMQKEKKESRKTKQKNRKRNRKD